MWQNKLAVHSPEITVKKCIVTLYFCNSFSLWLQCLIQALQSLGLHVSTSTFEIIFIPIFPSKPALVWVESRPSSERRSQPTPCLRQRPLWQRPAHSSPKMSILPHFFPSVVRRDGRSHFLCEPTPRHKQAPIPILCILPTGTTILRVNWCH